MGDDVAVVGVRGQGHVDGDRLAALAAQALAGDGEGADVAQPAACDLGDGGGEHVVAVEVEQLDGAADMEGEAAARERPALEEDSERGRDSAEAIAALEIARRLALATSSARCAGCSMIWRRP